MQELGFSLAELTCVQVLAKRQHSPASSKYLNAENSADTLIGCGRKLPWFEFVLAYARAVGELMALVWLG